MAYLEQNRADRARAILAVILLHLAAAAALVRGFDVEVTRAANSALRVFDLPALPPPPPPSPPPVRPEREQSGAEEGRAAPPALRARPKPVVAPEPQVRVPVMPRVTAPKVAADGAQDRSGAAPTPGPGTGAGGEGEGTGAGASGTGSGAGGSGEGLGAGTGRGAPARHLSGRITRGDYPRSAWREGVRSRVGVRFTVGPDGSVSNCRVVATSGDARVDRITCRTVEASFRYAPARNARGEPVASDIAWTQVLWTERD